jgi:uncharacterized protein RhaS with RHS repeats
LAGGLNNYQYVNNPTGWVDPLGLAGVKEGCPGEKDASGRPKSSPHYSVAYEATLEKDVHYPGKSDGVHFQEGNKQLHETMRDNPEYRGRLQELSATRLLN